MGGSYADDRAQEKKVVSVPKGTGRTEPCRPEVRASRTIRDKWRPLRQRPTRRWDAHEMARAKRSQGGLSATHPPRDRRVFTYIRT
jgi:hypothetical protein